MIVYEFPQYSPEWWATRRGIPTASCFGKIITPKTAKLSSQSVDYACRLIGDMFDPAYGQVEEAASLAMRQGIDMEPEARAFYCLDRDTDVRQIGFCTTDDGRFGCSPDSLVGEDGVLELKCPQAATHISYMLGGDLPDEYKAQVHGHLAVTGRAWCDFMSYCPGLPPFLVRTTPNVFTIALKVALESFWVSYSEMLAKVRAYGQEPTLAETLEASLAEAK